MKLIISVLWLFSIAPIGGIGLKTSGAPDLRLIVRIYLEHGHWDEKEQKCKEKKGWCKLHVDISTEDPPSNGPGLRNGQMWFEGGRLHWVAISRYYDADVFEREFSESKYQMTEDFELPDEVCDALGISRGYKIPAGSYDVMSPGSDYSPSDRLVVF